MTMPPLRLGIDLGGTAIKVALLRDAAPAVCISGAAYERPQREELAARLQQLWAEARRQGGVDETADLAVAVSVPGPVNAEGVVEAAANLPALVGLAVGAWVREVLGLARPPYVLTDALAAALGEYHADPRPGRTLYLALGAGVGGVVLDGGKPLLITRGTSGHFGHIDVSGGDPAAPSTPAAGRGALEAYIGAAALRRAGVDLDSPAGLAHPAFRQALAALSRGLRILLALYRPDRIVLLGGIGLKLQPVLGDLEALVRAGLTTAAPAHFTLSCGQAGYFAAALGAAQAAGPSAGSVPIRGVRGTNGG